MLPVVDKNIITVGVGDLKIDKSPRIIKTSLGSCMGVVLYDNKNKIGGMLHLMLAKCNDRAGKLSKYADTGIPLLVDLMVNKTNANKKMLTAILDYEGVVRCTTLKQIRNHLYIIKDHL